MLLQSYLLTQFSSALIFQTAALTGIVYLIQSLRLFKWIALRQISLGEFFSLSILMIPQFMTYLIPFSCLFSLLYVFQQFKSKRELIAFSVLGISDQQILRPVLWLVSGVVFLQIILHVMLPHSVQLFQKQEREFLSRIDLRMIKPQQFNTLNNAIIYIEKLSTFQGEICAQNIFLYYELPDRQFFITAKSAVIKGCGKKRIIQLTNGDQIQWNTVNKTKQELKFAHLDYNLGELKGRQFTPAEIVVGKEWRQIWRAGDIPSQAESLMRLSKIILPLLCFGLLAIFFVYQQFFLLAIGCCVINLCVIGLANVVPLLIVH